jgi:hypothetical protein
MSVEHAIKEMTTKKKKTQLKFSFSIYVFISKKIKLK